MAREEYAIARDYMGVKSLMREDGTFSKYGKAKAFTEAQARKWIDRHTYGGMSHSYTMERLGG